MPAALPTASQPSRLCYTRAAWSSAWVEETLLDCISIADQAAPGHSSATFRYRYGVAMLPAIGSAAADSSPVTKVRPDLKGNYVRVDITGLGSWWGVITDVDDHADGLINGTIPSGQQMLTALGLTWFLEQAEPVRESKVRKTSGTTTIKRGLAFNGGTGSGNRRDRVSWKNYDSAYQCFTSQLETASPAAWKASDAITYLFANHAPKNSSGVALVNFALAPDAASFLDYELPQIETHGQSVWQLLNRIIDRRRGLVWYAYVDSGTNSVNIKVGSQNRLPIVLSTSIIPANANQAAYNFETAVNIRGANVVTTLQTYYDQVVVESERVGSVFSVRPGVNFEADWTTAEKGTYNDGATLQTGFSSLTDKKKMAANMDARAVDALAQVFSWWKLKDAWNGRGETDPTSSTVDFAFPSIDEDGIVNTGVSAGIYQAGLRVMPYIPLRSGVDYSGTVTPETGTDDQREADYLPPIVLFQADPVNTGDTSDAGWIHAERINQATDSGATMRPFPFSVDVSVREDAPGLILRTVGSPQQYIADDLFVPDAAYEANPAGEVFDSDKWIATVYMLGDDFCRGVWPPASALPLLDLVRQLSIHVAGAHLDFLIPETIVGTHFGALVKATGGQLRDDRERLEDIAKLAHSWYGTERRTLNLSFRSIVSGFNLGHLITTIGSGATLETINTVITSIQYDLANGTTQLNTQFGELDFTQ